MKKNCKKDNVNDGRLEVINNNIQNIEKFLKKEDISINNDYSSPDEKDTGNKDIGTRETNLKSLK